jgi:hypothetical protein
MQSLERLFGPHSRIKYDKRDEGRIGIEGSGKTTFDKKSFPWGYSAQIIRIQRSDSVRDTFPFFGFLSSDW